ncbi:MAG TPA: ABC transporter permease [Vicinamibacterales bacterium]|nr:ABC transporter permease [Vicinamibacterales bacterium]
MNLRDLFLRIRALVTPHRVERELDEELAFHVERETQKHMAAGLSPADARTRARARFGPVSLVADQCRDVRGISLVDDVGRDVLYAWRTFRRAPLAALTIVATVALGLGLVTAVFTIYALFMLRTDAVRNPGELFAVGIEQLTGPGSDPDTFTLSDYDALRRETSVFTDTVAMGGWAGRVEGRLARSTFVTGNFFRVLGVQSALGRPLLPSDDERFAGQPVIVLSHTGWRKWFKSDPAVIGRRMIINGAPYEIVGVMPDGFRGLGTTPPDYWAPLALAGQLGDELAGRGNEIPVEIVGRLKPSLSREAAAGTLTRWASGRPEFKAVPGRQIRVWLAPRQGTLAFGNSEALVLFSPLFFAFGLILTIGCANVANLLLARGVSRQREIGIRLSLGASRRRIIRQLLTESLLLALVAAACGLAVSRLVLEGLLYAAITTIPPDFADFVSLLNLAAPGSDWRVLVFLIVGAVASTMFFGLAPALQATRLDLVPTMRGEVTRNARPRRARHGLIAIQVGASALLLICAAVFLRGAFAAATRDPGVRTIDTLSVNIDAETRRPEVLQELRADPLVAVMAASSPSTRGIIRTSASASRVEVEQLAVSSDYFDVLGFDLVSGRSFTQAERTPNAGVVIVADTVARQQWPKGDAVGQVLSLEAPSRTLTVVGVVRDPERTIYLPTGPETPGTDLTLRVRGNPDQARRALLGRLPGLDPAFGVMTLRTLTGMQTYLLQSAFWVTIVLGGLALVLTVSGLFSVLTYLVEQQAKEIGVRMALGAATKHVAGLVLTQSIRPVGIGLAAGIGLAGAVATVLMATPAAAQIRESVDVFDPVAYIASALVIATASLIAVSVPTLRAARIDPMATLRKD